MAVDREGADGHGVVRPELLRIKGEVLLRQATESVPGAEDCFAKAAQMAREQGALFWELRIALSVARLRVAKVATTRREHRLHRCMMLHRRFANADMLAARTLLEGLRRSA